MNRKIAIILYAAAIILTSCSHRTAELPKIKTEEPISKISRSVIPPDGGITESSPTAHDLKKIPRSILIPKLHVDAPIEAVGLDAKGRMATVPDARVIGWYKYGSTPGQGGNAILAGHRDWKGSLGSFYNIEKLKTGDSVTIRFEDDSMDIFEVTSNNTYRLGEVPEKVMDLTGDPHVTLITCTDRFDKKVGGYQSRAVVVLREVNE